MKLTPVLKILLFLFSILIFVASCSKETDIDEPNEPGKPEKPVEEDKHQYPDPISEDAYAFPGAYGGGMFTTGGRGGKVIKVTSLEDTNQPGTLRYAVNQSGARIVVFEIDGTVFLKSKLEIKNDHITIAGQSAPGGGITLAGYPVEIKANNVIMRYLRFRMGDIEGTSVGADGADALGGRNRENIIIDHCSMSWSTDECTSFYDNKNFTMQWCLLSESLRLSGHTKGAHGYGGIWGGVNASFLYNLLMHHDSRNPRFCGSRYSGNSEQELVDFRNNVIYNWGANNVYGAEGGNYNIVGNYYKPGPDSSNRNRLIQPYADDGKNTQAKGAFGRLFLEGNYIEGNATVTGNNKSGVHLHNTFATHAPGITLNDVIATEAFNTAASETFSAAEAYDKVLANAGSSRIRDAVDIRLIEEVKTNNPQFIGLSELNVSPYPKRGIIDSQKDLHAAGQSGTWSAWPDLQKGELPVDTDNDGMPDAWEISKGLDPETPDAGGRHLSTAYDNIEVYLNELAKKK